MKKRNITIAVVIVLLIASLFLVYQRMINVFDEKTIVGMTVSSDNGLTTQYYALDETKRKMLTSNMRSQSDTDLTPDEATAFKMTLLNKWDISEHYWVYMLKSGDVLIQNEKKEQTKVLASAIFFKSHEAFDAYYSDALFPEITVKLNNKLHPYSIQNHQWFFRRLNNEWVQKNKSFSPEELPPQEVVTEDDELYIFSEKKADKIHYRLIDTVSDIELENKDSDEHLPLPTLNGSYQYIVDLEWLGEDTPYKGTATVEFDVDVKKPPKFTLKQPAVEQGALIVIEAVNVDKIEDITVEQSLSDKGQWFYSDGVYTFVIPTNYNTTMGEHTLTVKNAQTASEETFNVKVQARGFRTQQLTIDPNVESTTRSDEAYAEYRQYFKPVRLESSGEKYYIDDAFVLPTKGRLNTEFGEMRSVNGAMTTYRHSGIDIGASAGTPVLATNKGKVVFTMDMMLTGKTIIIDHGHGLFSIYEHLDDILVEEGAMVEAGAEIGKVGSTGFSTGPHLHFTMSYYDIDLEPGHFIIGESFSKETMTHLE